MAAVAWNNVLIVTGGQTPQVVSETVFALAHRMPDQFVPHRIICAVTADSAARFAEELPDQLKQLAHEWDIPMQWGRIELRYPTYAKDDPDSALRGQPVADIRSDRDAVQFGNLVAQIVQEATADAASRVHLSLAGGRKTMSFHGGAALSLFARPQDELSHVLVHPASFEQVSAFWFPTSGDHWLEYTPRGQTTPKRLNAKDARIELALIPFVRVRERLPSVLLTRPMDYAAQVTEANAALGRVQVRLELVTLDQLVIAGDLTRFTLEAGPFALYQVMAEWMRDQVPGAGPDGVGPQHKGWLTSRMFTYPGEFRCNAVQRFMQIYKATFRSATERGDKVELVLTDMPANERQRADNGRYLSGAKSKLLRAISEQFTQSFMAERFGAWEDPGRGKGTVRRFGLRMLPEEIEIREE